MKTVAGFIIALALVVAVVPQFTDCQSRGHAIQLGNGRAIPMRCHWTARAELALGVPLLALGVTLLASRRRETQRALTGVGLMLGAAVAMVAWQLIGVCPGDGMLCSLVMKPTLLLAGTLVVAVCGVALLLCARPADEAS